MKLERDIIVSLSVDGKSKIKQIMAFYLPFMLLPGFVAAGAVSDVC